MIRLALVPENETDGFNPSLITVLNKDGKLIRLDQLLKVTRQEEAPQSYYRINGLNSIYLSIRAEETANQLELAKRVRAEMEYIRTLLPPGYEIHTSYDATEFIQDELNKIYVRTGLTVLILLIVCLADHTRDKISVTDHHQPFDQPQHCCHPLLSVRTGNAALFVGRRHNLTQPGDRQHDRHDGTYPEPT